MRQTARQWLPPVALGVRRRVLARRDGVGQDQHRLIPQRWEDYDAAAERVARERRFGWPAVMRAMRDADVAVIHGASLHGNLSIPRTILFLAYLVKARCGKPIMIANHTADLEDPVLRTLAEHVYPLVDDVTYRDQISAEKWSRVYGGRFAGDTAFWFEPADKGAWAPLAGRPTYFDVWPDTAAFDPSAPYLCVGGSSIFHDRKDWGSLVEGYARLVEHVRSVYAGAIVLTASAELDETAFRPLAERSGLPLVGVRTPVQQAVDVVGNADAYIGGRWHPSIFALRGGAPLIPLSSQTFKMRALAELTGSSATFDALDLVHEAPAIGRQLSLCLEQGVDLRQKLKAWAEGMAERSWENVAYLRRLSPRAEIPVRGEA